MTHTHKTGSYEQPMNTLMIELNTFRVNSGLQKKIEISHFMLGVSSELLVFPG